VCNFIYFESGGWGGIEMGITIAPIYWDAVQSIVKPEMETTHCECEA